MTRQGVQFRTAMEQKFDRECFSTDMGNVTYVVPSIHPTFEVSKLYLILQYDREQGYNMKLAI